MLRARTVTGRIWPFTVPITVRMARAAAGERGGAERLGPASRGVAELTAEEPDDRVGQVVLAGVAGEVVTADTGSDQLQRQVSDGLRGRGDLDQPAEELVGGGVGVL